MVESSWRSHHRGVIMEESSWRSHHGGVIMSHLGGVIMEESSWSVEEVSWRSLGALWGLPGRSLGTLWGLSGGWGGLGVAMGFWRPKVSKFIVCSCI